MKLKNYAYRTEKSFLYWIKLLPNLMISHISP